jgi:hypothetical protein
MCKKEFTKQPDKIDSDEEELASADEEEDETEEVRDSRIDLLIFFTLITIIFKNHYSH